jgi:para-aminobenzoate synthetase/4-amino-4-deoxychorismate lyase
MARAEAAGPAGGPLGGLTSPYVLLEDRLSPSAQAWLYRDPVAIVCSDDPAGLDDAFSQIEDGLARGLHAAGLFSYELGYALEPKLSRLMPERRDEPLVWFGLFDAPKAIAADDLDAAFAGLGPPPPITALQAGRDRALHVDKVRRILELIAAGDLYQANLTFPMRFRYDGDPLALYGALRVRQPVAHGGVAALGGMTVLSVSPELWVDVSGDQATTRPMKGTTARATDPCADQAARLALADDPKQRAENLMIVDLLRNDLARISAPGSVQAPALFTVETYPSFHTLTSTVTARLRQGLSLRDRVAALFPCGSVVGAPKIRAGEVIRMLEREPRGFYTGALGRIAAGGDMTFNVAIRTAVLSADGEARYGVGGGIVADSDPDAEYDEALLKARVLCELADDYGLIETFRWSAGQGFVRLPLHLDRLAASAAQLGFEFDRAALERELAARHGAWAGRGEDLRVRALLARTGVVTITQEALAAQPSRRLRIGVAEHRLDAGDPFLRHKTTRRDAHEQAFTKAAGQGLDEALLLNQRGAVAEASRNTVFARIGGRLVTPRLECGVLPGVLRRELIAGGQAIEGDLTLEDLERAKAWFLGNSLHGLREAELFSRRLILLDR